MLVWSVFMVCIEMLLKMMRRWLAKRRVNLRQWLDSEPKTAWEYAVIGFFYVNPEYTSFCTESL